MDLKRAFSLEGSSWPFPAIILSRSQLSISPSICSLLPSCQGPPHNALPLPLLFSFLTHNDGSDNKHARTHARARKRAKKRTRVRNIRGARFARQEAVGNDREMKPWRSRHFFPAWGIAVLHVFPYKDNRSQKISRKSSRSLCGGCSVLHQTKNGSKKSYRRLYIEPY
jgi:hypothetical protein